MELPLRSKASNAALAKARAMYGERLGVPTPYNSVFADLIRCVQANYDNQYGAENG